MLIQRYCIKLEEKSRFIKCETVDRVKKGNSYYIDIDRIKARADSPDGIVELTIGTDENGPLKITIDGDGGMDYTSNQPDDLNANIWCEGIENKKLKIRIPEEFDKKEFQIYAKWKNGETLIAENKITVEVEDEDKLEDEGNTTVKMESGKSGSLCAIPILDESSVLAESENNEILDCTLENSKTIGSNLSNISLKAKSPGNTTLKLKSENQSENNTTDIDIKVEQFIKTIDIKNNITEISLPEGKEETIEVTVNPENATEGLKFKTSDLDVAEITQDAKNNNVYKFKIKGNNAGTAQITFSGRDISKTVTVNVKKHPEIKNITVENSGNKKKFKAGDEIIINVEFDEKIKGTVPDLSIKFGDHYSVNKVEKINEIYQDTTLRYKYVIADGDNGELMVVRLQNGKLTNLVGDVTATTVLENEGYYPSAIRLLKSSGSASDSEEEIEDVKPEDYLNTGIYQNTGVEADTEVESIKLYSDVDKDCNWLKNGDVVKVKIVPEEVLQEKPVVTFNGIQASVEETGDTYTASMPVTEKLADGYVEVKVDNIIDEMGNKKDAIVATKTGIDDPIIIDNSAPIISSINIMKKQGEEVKEGESIDIVVNFKDSVNVTKEYIVAEKTPGLNLKIGEKDAKGTLVADYKAGDYVQAIKYTYTVAKEDKGQIKVEKMSGIVTDIAGNSTDLSTLEIRANENANPEDNNPTTPVDKKETTNPSSNTSNVSKTPKTGDKILMITAIFAMVALTAVIVELLYRRNKRDI